MTPQQGTIVVGDLVGEEMEWSLEELCHLFAVEPEWVVELVEQGVLETLTAAAPRCGCEALRRVRIAVRLRRDLGLNAAGTALALDLLERIQELERQLRRTGP